MAHELRSFQVRFIVSAISGTDALNTVGDYCGSDRVESEKASKRITHASVVCLAEPEPQCPQCGVKRSKHAWGPMVTSCSYRFPS